MVGRANHKENHDLERTMQARGREERGVTCRRRQHLRRSGRSKCSDSKESCVPKCCSKMHVSRTEEEEWLGRPVLKGEMNTGVPCRI